MRVTFDEVAITATKRWVDENGRKRQKTKRFYQTINPFNKNAEGLPKTRSEIMDEILAARKAWLESDSRE